MGGVLDAVRSMAGGVAQAAGNQTAHDDLQAQVQRDRAAKQQQLQLQIAPLSEALRADQTRLALYANPDDPTKPLAGKEAEYKQTLDRMTQTIGQMRGLYGGKPQGANPVEAGVGNLLDSLHITNHLKNHVANVRAENAKKYADQTGAMASATATGAMPFEQTTEGQKLALQERLRKEGARVEWQNFVDPKTGDVVPIDVAHQTPPPGYVKAGPESLTAKAKKGIGFLGSETSPVGLVNKDTGDNYLPSQLGPNGSAPPEYKEAWQAVQVEKQRKIDDEYRKEDERNKHTAEIIGASFARMGAQQQFQENMAQYRSDLTTYRALDKDARTSEETVDALKHQYEQPGNHAVADNELQNFYTSVVQKGGRKTAAELNLTLKIGSFGMNLEQMAQKAATGELPDDLRKALWQGMAQVAKEQREMADQTKPELPQVTAPEGPKTRALKQVARGGWAPPADAPAAPKQDGKFLKADGKIIAKSQGGKWVQP
jgi:hypothetical protein